MTAWLTFEMKLTEYGAAADIFTPTKEDVRSVALAVRARQGDYDNGITFAFQPTFTLLL